MKLRVRLLWVTTTMVVIVASTLTTLSLNSITASSLETATASSEGAAREIQSFLLRRLSAATAGADSGVRDQQVVADTDLTAVLEQSMAQSRSVVEINVGNRAGTVLASSNPRRLGAPMAKPEELRILRDAGPWQRLRAILSGREDYETRVTLGVAGETKALFTVQVLFSPILLRDATLPRLQWLMLASAMALALAVGLAWFTANLALRPLARISYLIDDIASGRSPESAAQRRGGSPELAVIESKLGLLGEQYRGARADASQLRTDLDDAMEKLDAGSRVQLEAQVAVARRLTAINSLTRGVAHEIKNPLNSIVLRLELLRERVAEESPGAEGEFSILAEEVARLDRVVKTFLDFNRPVELELVDVDVAEDIGRMLELLAPETAAKHITVTLEKPAEPVRVRADAGLLRQALLNIAVNGMEAMEGGGCLEVRVARVGDQCKIRIADTGKGLPPEQRERIFQLYFTTKPGGTGIGLAMAFRAVQLHGGTIEVQSELGTGTVFEVTLPVAGKERWG